MSQETPSNASAVPNNGSSKRTRKASSAPAGTAPNPSSTATTPSPVLQTPLTAALASGTCHVETLHREAQPFLKEFLKNLLGQFATHYWKQKKLQEMVDNPDYVPSSCKHGLTLNAVQEVRESEDFITLNMQLETEIAQQQRTNAAFALRVYDMNRRAHLRRYKNTFCKLLPAAARVFLAQFGVEYYGVHQVVMDLLAVHSDEILTPLRITLIDFLLLYREANEIAILPSPTVLNDIYHVIDAVNGPRPGEEPPEAAAATATAAASNEAPLASNQTETQLVLRMAAPGFQAEPTPSPVNEETVVAAGAPAPAPPPLPPLPPSPPHDPTSLAVAAAVATGTSATVSSTPQSAVRNPYLRDQRAFTPPAPRFTLPVHHDNRNAHVDVNGADTAPDGNEDEVMEDDAPEVVVIGGRDVIIRAVRDLAVKGFFNSTEIFDKQVRLQEESKRVKKATLKPQLSSAAERIAAIVNAERPVAPATLRGLVREEATSNTSQMERELQSLKAQMELLMSGKKKPSPTQHQKKGNHANSNTSAKNGKGGGKGKAATKKNKPPNHLKAAGSKPATTAVNKNKRPNPSKNKSSGKKPAGGKKKRS